MFESYSQAARLAIMFARLDAGRVGVQEIDTEHLLLGVMRTDSATMQEIAPELTLDAVRARSTRWHSPMEKLPDSADLPLSSDAQTVLEKVTLLAGERGSVFVRTEYLLLALATTASSHAAVILEQAGARVDRLKEIVSQLDGSQQLDLGRDDPVNIAWTREFWGDLNS